MASTSASLASVAMARSGVNEQRDEGRRTDEVDGWLPRMEERPAVLARGLTARTRARAQRGWHRRGGDRWVNRRSIK